MSAMTWRQQIKTVARGSFTLDGRKCQELESLRWDFPGKPILVGPKIGGVQLRLIHIGRIWFCPTPVQGLRGEVLSFIYLFVPSA